MKYALSKYISYSLLVVVIIILITATILEKMYDTTFVINNIYGTWWFICLWAHLCMFSVMLIIKRKVYRRPATLLLHTSFILILAGALVTHLYGLQASIHLRKGESTNVIANKETGKTDTLPFMVKMVQFSLKTYPGTQSPMDYMSEILITDKEEQTDTSLGISMNNIGEYKSYRFYQSGYDADMQGTYLSISYDPYGIGITYTGYALLLISTILFMVLPNEGFQRLLRHRKAKAALLLVICLGCSTLSSYASSPSVLPKETAAGFGNLYTYYNGRVCPFQTVAIDFTTKIYGKPTYKGYSAEQVITGWMLFPTTWIDEPFIKIKKGIVKKLLNTQNDYVSYNDFFSNEGYRLDTVLAKMHGGTAVPNAREINEADEKMNLILMLFNGELIKIYPDCIKEKTAIDNNAIVWYSQADNLPEDMPHDQWFFIKHSMDYIGELANQKDYKELTATVKKIRKYQEKTVPNELLPSDMVFKSEKLYNSINFIKPLSMILLTVGIVAYILGLITTVRHQKMPHWFNIALITTVCISLSYLLIFIGLRSIISHHIPLANGFEVMLFMSLCSLILTLCLWKNNASFRSFGLIMAGLTMLVAMMGQSNPQITPLMPVLASPLLSVHVCVIMMSYTLFAFIALNSIATLLTHKFGSYSHTDTSFMEDKSEIALIMLYPAIFLLTIGIFIGAIWANVSWGRYWGWDPKEVWALITMLVYSFPLHRKSISWFKKPTHLHWYLLLAFLTVIITYFGVNFFLGGVHSYANS